MNPALIGTDTLPAVRKGDVATGLYQDAGRTVTGGADGSSPWPGARGAS